MAQPLLFSPIQERNYNSYIFSATFSIRETFLPLNSLRKPKTKLYLLVACVVPGITKRYILDRSFCSLGLSTLSMSIINHMISHRETNQKQIKPIISSELCSCQDRMWSSSVAILHCHISLYIHDFKSQVYSYLASFQQQMLYIVHHMLDS